MTVAEELIVALRSEGATEVQDELENVQDTMEETGDSVAETGENLEGFQQEISGAMSAVVAGLAIAAGGLLSQVPVIGEAAEGLFAVIDAIAFRMDSVLRPALQPLTDLLFKVTEIINDADGPFGKFIGIVASTAAALVVLSGVALTAVKVGGALAGAWGTIAPILGTVAGAITTVIGAIVSLPGAVAIGIAAALALVAAYLTNFRGMRDKTNKIFSNIGDAIVSTFFKVKDSVTDWISGFISMIVGFGSDVASAFLDGLKALPQNLVDLFAGAFNKVIDVINGVINKLPSEITSRVGIEGGIGNIDSPTLGGGGVSGGTAQSIQREGAFGGGSAINIDGRRVDEQTGRFGRDTSARRGI